MRELFIVGIKLYGAVSLFSGISSGFVLIQIARMGPTPPGTAFSWLIPAAVSFLIVFAAITQAERLADLFGLTTKSSTGFSGFSVKAALKVGLILIGASQFLRAIPALIQELIRAADPVMANSPISNLGVLVQALIPLALICGANKIIDFIEKVNGRGHG